ncbi:Ada metal-binding domain-containing protein [Dyadobacter sp. CY326]|uniref:Ada metal-binding domain-containing protein n=1 Tax=Dyadobacter sp. CY326 TaxID=2907300 RepID=UPI001F1D5D54|nr:Ada metal-binding domain-containing protein [Dyadobacter sp. CY326]MCE7064745.1 metal-binding protein [Dyadobacter sp. CY326]
MIYHSELGHYSFATSRKLKALIDNGLVKLGGNGKLKIYGTLNCSSGKRMKQENRVFFRSEEDAILHGFRPCGHCMRSAYAQWKEKVFIPKP